MSGRRADRWSRWQNRRIAALAAEGLPVALAVKIGWTETCVRKRLSSRIGWAAARKAALICLPDTGGGLRFALAGKFGNLDDEQLKRLQELPGLREVQAVDLAGSVPI